MLNWALALGCKFKLPEYRNHIIYYRSLLYLNTETILFTIDPYYGIALDEVPEQESSKVSEDPGSRLS